MHSGLRASEGAGVGTSLCSLCLVESHEMRRDNFYSAFRHMHTQRHALKRARPILFSGEVMRFDAIIPRTSEHRLAAFSLWVCVCVCVPVKWAVLFLHSVGGSFHC